jgi:hypothetical protein
MLTDLSQEVANCYQRAAECAERAGTCKNAEMREFYIERENAWIKLARSYQFSERLARQFGELKSKRLRDWPATAHRVRIAHLARLRPPSAVLVWLFAKTANASSIRCSK